MAANLPGAALDGVSHIFLKKVVVLFLLLTSVPAGFSPLIVLKAQKEIDAARLVLQKSPGSYASQLEIGRDESIRHTAWMVLAVSGSIHLLAVAIFIRYWKSHLFALSGAAWVGIAWAAFAVGAGFGIWIYLDAPMDTLHFMFAGH